MAEFMRLCAFVVGLHDHGLLASITAGQDDHDFPLLQKLRKKKKEPS